MVKKPFSCHIYHIGTCSKKIQSEVIMQIKKIFTPRHIQKWTTSVVYACYGCSRMRKKTLSHKMAIRLESVFPSFPNRRLTVKAVWGIKNRARGKLIVNFVIVNSVQ